MTIDEQHVRVELGLQKIASDQYDNILPEEIDLALNIAQDRFIKLRLSSKKPGEPGFAGTQRRLDDLRQVLVKNRVVEVYIPQVTDADYEPDAVYGYLPEDYLFLVNDRSLVVSSLDGNCLKKPKPKRVTTSTVVSYVPFPLSTREDCPYYKQLQVVLTYFQNQQEGSIVLFDNASTSFKNGINSKERFELIRLLTESMNANPLGLVFYWETYGEVYKPNNFIVVGKNITGTFTVRVDEQSVTSEFTNSPYTQYELEPEWDQEYRPNRVTNPEDVYDLVRHPFARTRRNSPISTLSRNRLYVYEGKDFLVGRVLIDYIRQPRRLSKRDGLSCELAAHTHQEIVDLAIEYLHLSTANPLYSAKVSDDINRGE